jgi:hypothetical protein
MLRFIALLALGILTVSAFAVDVTLPPKVITLTDTYGLFAMKWVTSDTAQNKVSAAAEKYTATAQSAVSSALTRFSKKPTADRVDKLQSSLEKLVRRAKGQTSLVALGAGLETRDLALQAGLAGEVTVGDGSSGGGAYSFTLSETWTGKVDGVTLTVYFTALPATTEGPYIFCACIPSPSNDSSLALGVFTCVIVDPALLTTAAASGMTNTTTPEGGTAVAVPFALKFSSAGTTTHQGSSTFAANYFSIQDLMGAAVPPEIVTAVQDAFAKLQEKLAKAQAAASTSKTVAKDF